MSYEMESVMLLNVIVNTTCNTCVDPVVLSFVIGFQYQQRKLVGCVSWVIRYVPTYLTNYH